MSPTTTLIAEAPAGTANFGKPTASSKPLERRKSSRYPVQQDLNYRVIHAEDKSTGTGRTLDFSSSGILFWSQEPIRIGRVVEVSVNWPVLLGGTCGMKVVAAGPVVRVDGHRIALRITRYEFHTKSSRAPFPANGGLR